MKELKRVSFDNKAEFIVALLEGRTFVTHWGGIILYDEKHLSPFRYTSEDGSGSSALKSCWGDYRELREVTQVNWYDNIPEEGILCWVWDEYSEHEDPSKKTIALIVKYFEDHTLYSYQDSSGLPWDFAEPAKLHEVINRIYKES